MSRKRHLQHQLCFAQLLEQGLLLTAIFSSGSSGGSGGHVFVFARAPPLSLALAFTPTPSPAIPAIPVVFVAVEVFGGISSEGRCRHRRRRCI
jgi:hypothetical protein